MHHLLNCACRYLVSNDQSPNSESPVEERLGIRHYLQVEVPPKVHTETEAINAQSNYPKCFDDDGRLKRTGTFWTATAHIVTAVIGSGVLSLAWAIAQLGWVAGPTITILFAFLNLYTSNLLAQCYRSGDPTIGQRNYTYMDAVKANLGGFKVKICGWIQYVNLIGIAIGYTIAAAVSMIHGKDPCHMSSSGYMITFGVIEVLFSQIPDLDQVWWLSIVAAVMSFTYSAVGLGVGVSKVAENRSFKGSLMGVMGVSIGTLTRVGTVTPTQKMWRSLQALGAIAFAYSFSIILIEIQDTIRSPPAEHETMRKATTLISMLLPFFNDVVGILGAFGFWPLTVYFPIEMYIAQKKIPAWTRQWCGLQLLSVTCLAVSMAAAVGSVAGVVLDLKTYKPFKTSVITRVSKCES